MNKMNLNSALEQHRICPETGVYILEQLLELQIFTAQFYPKNYDIDLNTCKLSKCDFEGEKNKRYEASADTFVISQVCKFLLRSNWVNEPKKLASDYHELLNNGAEQALTKEGLAKELKKIRKKHSLPKDAKFRYGDYELGFRRTYDKLPAMPPPSYDVKYYKVNLDEDIFKVITLQTTLLMSRAALAYPLFFENGCFGRRLLKLQRSYVQNMDLDHDGRKAVVALRLLEQFYQENGGMTTFGISCKYRNKRRMREMGWRMLELRRKVDALLDALTLWKTGELTDQEVTDARQVFVKAMKRHLTDDVPFTMYLVVQETELIRKVLDSSFREFMLENEKQSMPVTDIGLLAGNELEKLDAAWDLLPDFLVSIGDGLLKAEALYNIGHALKKVLPT